MLTPYHFSPAFFDVIRTGRFLWTSVCFTIPGGTLQAEDLRSSFETLDRRLAERFENCSCALILTPEGAPPHHLLTRAAPRQKTQRTDPWAVRFL